MLSWLLIWFRYVQELEFTWSIDL